MNSESEDEDSDFISLRNSSDEADKKKERRTVAPQV